MTTKHMPPADLEPVTLSLIGPDARPIYSQDLFEMHLNSLRFGERASTFGVPGTAPESSAAALTMQR